MASGHGRDAAMNLVAQIGVLLCDRARLAM